MKATPLEIPDVLVLEPRVFEDERGFFFESFNLKRFRELTGSDAAFVQDNHSRSQHGVLRGLHYQIGRPQGKLVRVISGEVFDVAVDIRRSSRHFGQWVGARLNALNRQQLWIPEGFAHGFFVLSETAEVLYKTTGFYDPPSERSIHWNDPQLAIDWPLKGRDPLVSDKDQSAPLLRDAELFS